MDGEEAGALIHEQEEAEDEDARRRADENEEDEDDDAEPPAPNERDEEGDDEDDSVILDNRNQEDGGGHDDDEIVIDVETFMDNLHFDESAVYLSDEMTNAVHKFSDADMQELLDTVSGQPRMEPSRIFINLTGDWHDTEVAERITKLLQYFDLSGVKDIHCEISSMISYSNNNANPHVLKVMEHYLSFLNDSIPPGTHFEHVFVSFHGYGEGEWSKFLKLFTTDRLRISCAWTGPSIENSCMAAGLIHSLRDLSSLQPVELALDTADASPSVALLFQALQHLTRLESLSVALPRSQHCDTAAAVDGLSALVFLSKSLKSLSVDARTYWYSREPRTDCRKILESALHSDVLESLKLKNGALQTTSLLPGVTTSNESIRQIALSDCTVEDAGWSLLHRFQGLRTLRLIDIRSDSYHVSFSETLNRLPHLEAISDTSSASSSFFYHSEAPRRDISGYLRRFCQQTRLATFAGGISEARNLSNLHLETMASDREGHNEELPALRDLVRTSRGSLTLVHIDNVGWYSGYSNFGHIWTGLDSSSLTELNLCYWCSGLSPSSVIAFLSVLNRKRNLRTFTGVFWVASDWDSGCLNNVLFDLIASSSNLKTFGLRLLASESSPTSSSDSYDISVLRAVVRALQHNQTLTTLLSTKVAIDAVLPSLQSLLRQNTALEQVRSLKFDQPVELEVKWLLDLNRYKRRCLLEPDRVPHGCWTSVVERIAEDRRPDVMYHFMKRIPHSALRARRGRRRVAPLTDGQDVST